MMPDYQCVTEVAVTSSRLPEFVPARWLLNSAGWIRDMVMQMHLWHFGVAEPPCEGHPLPRQMALEHCQCHIGLANYGNMWHGNKSLASHGIVVVRWHSTAELTPLRSVRPSYRFLRPRSRENLSPAGTSHFPRPWVGHVRRTAPHDRQPKVLSIWI